MVRLHLDRRPHLLRWAQHHRDEYELFMSCLRVCNQAAATIQGPFSTEVRAEVTVVMTIAHFQGRSIRPEQMSTARQDSPVQRLAQHLMIYWVVKSHSSQDVPGEVVAMAALYACEYRGLVFTIPNKLLQREVQTRTQERRPQQQSMRSNRGNPIDLTNEEIHPPSQQNFCAFNTTFEQVC